MIPRNRKDRACCAKTCNFPVAHASTGGQPTGYALGMTNPDAS